MAAQVASVAFAAYDQGGSETVSAPSGVQAGDLLLAFLYFPYGSEALPSAPSGWTLLNNGPAVTTTNNPVGCYYKVASASEPSSYTFTVSDSSEYIGVALARVTGASGVDATNTAAAVSTGSTAKFNTVKSTVANDLLVLFGAEEAGSTPTASQWPNVAPSGTTLKGNDVAYPSNAFGVASVTQSSVGTSTAYTVAVPARTTFFSVIVAVKSASSGGGGGATFERVYSVTC